MVLQDGLKCLHDNVKLAFLDGAHIHYEAVLFNPADDRGLPAPELPFQAVHG